MNQNENVSLFARSNLLSFAVSMREAYETPWHIRKIAKKLQELEQRKIKRLMIFIPPRHGKSHLANELFPAWYMGRNPHHEVITTSYSQEVASGFGRKVRNMMNEPSYQLIFPGVTPTDDSFAAHRFNITDGGAYYAVGAGGPLTSRGASLIIIDDIHKNRFESLSDAILTRIKEWFGPVLYTRLAPNGVVVLIQTRWSDRDLPGHLLDTEGDRWEVLSLPAISDENEALWPERFPLETLAEIKRTLGSRDFTSLYQQRPSPEEGDIVKRSWWNFYKELPGDLDQVAISADLTFKDGEKNDFTVFQVWGRKGSNKYLLDQVRDRMGFNAQLMALRALVGKWPTAQAKWIEDSANGAALVQTLSKQIAGIIPVRPKGSKIARAEAIAPQIEAGNVYLPDPSIAPFINDFIEEWAVFPNGKHDDQCDTASMALMKLNEGYSVNFLPISMTGQSKWLGR